MSTSSVFQSIDTTNNNNSSNNNNNNNDSAYSHIDYIMKYGNEKATNYNDLFLLQSNTKLIEYRYKVISWLKKVTTTYNLDSLIRDTSYQLFDTYLLNLLRNNNTTTTNNNNNSSSSINNINEQEKTISLAAISCILVSSKLHNYHSILSFANFNDFDYDDLSSYQFEFLSIINFDIHVNTTPAVCIEVLLSLWNGDDELKSSIKSQSDIFVSEFHTLPVSMMFAPSTIAICAIILSFSTLRMDCSQWLNSVPDQCFRKSASDTSDHSLLDIDKCLDIFQRVETVHHMLPKCSSLSPTSVVQSSPCTTPNINATTLGVSSSFEKLAVVLPSSSSSNNFDRYKDDDQDLYAYNAELGILDIDAIEEDSHASPIAISQKLF